MKPTLTFTKPCFQTRSITIREPNGRLRKATWEERDRMNLIYFPKPGRKHEMPELLQDKNLKVINQGFMLEWWMSP